MLTTKTATANHAHCLEWWTMSQDGGHDSFPAVAHGARTRPSMARRSAFTLLELLLALALAAIVLFLINMAIDLHLRSLDSRRVQLEETQLARSVMRVIADDVRSVVQSYKQDVSGVQAMMQQAATSTAAAALNSAQSTTSSGGQTTTGSSTSQSTTGSTQSTSSSSQQSTGSSTSTSTRQGSISAPTGGFMTPSSGATSGGATSGGATSGGATSSGTSSSGASGTTGSSATSEESSVASSDLSSVTVTDVPGIFGNQYQLQLDISRLPRPEEYQQYLSNDPNATLVDIPSDVKTVTYYVMTSDTNTSTSSTMLSNATPIATLADPSNYTTGLVRREMDRAVTSWANTNGNLSGLESGDEVIAPEVVSLEFAYFDGSEWLTEWDTSVEEMLPIAIQVIVGITSTVRSTSNVPTTTSTDGTQNVRYYSMIIQLPTGGSPAANSGSSSETGESTTSSTGSTSTGATGGTSTGTSGTGTTSTGTTR